MMSFMIYTVLKHITWFFLRILIATYKFEFRGIENFKKAQTIQSSGSFIFAIWHEQLLSVLTAHAHTKPYMALASRSKDGDVAAHIAKKLGFQAVRGSSRNRRGDKGGKEALAEYVENLSKGLSGGITIDGPKGPRHVCKPGVVIMSHKTGSPILPTISITSSYWEFNTWDRFKVPKPFAKIIIVYGEPIQIPQNNDPKIFQQGTSTVAASMKALTSTQS
jgi:lysophospholipid acyltransferase (LPLAT)-like uncharacterized protein